MAQFYAPNLQITDTSYFLTEEESKHCIRVLRMQVDDSLELINGKGLLFQVIIIEAHPKKCSLIIGFEHFSTEIKKLKVIFATK